MAGPYGTRKAVVNNFQRLVGALNKVLEPSCGLDSSEVNPRDIQHLMEGYASKEKEWLKYALEDMSRGYTRNQVDDGNGKSNLLVLVWTPGKGSPIHDHASAHCVMKILRGSLTETRYDWPDLKAVPRPLRVRQETTFRKNEVTYMSDKLGLHKISNPDPHTVAVSLHLYTPPNAARFGCQVFDEASGKSSHIRQSNFFSDRGNRL